MDPKARAESAKILVYKISSKRKRRNPEKLTLTITESDREEKTEAFIQRQWARERLPRWP
jgi:hypothetical protein